MRAYLRFAVILPFALAAAPAVAQNAVDLVCEYKESPLGIDVTNPRLSWKVDTTEPNWMQSAYRIQVASSSADLTTENRLLWDSGKVLETASVHRVYEGPPLQSSTRYYWRVQVWDASDQTLPWSATAWWEMGLLDATDWLARWITPSVSEDKSQSQPAPMLRRTFDVARKVRSARAYVTSLGLYEMELNGVRVGDELFTPGWTAYRKRLQYQTYDVTAQLHEGDNAIGVSLGDGWYRGFIGFEGQRNYYGDTLALLAQIRIVYEDGEVQIVGTDTTWKSFTEGPIRASDIYMGEVYDARREEPGFSRRDYDDSAWSDVRVVPSPEAKLIAAVGPPVRRMEEIRPIAILRTPDGDTVFDMGQNMVGWVRVQLDPRASWAGRTITLKHAEVLDSEGNFYTENLRGATQQVQFILDEDRSIYEPHFTFQGFRYVAVDGYPGEATLDSLTGIVIHSDMKVTGTFETSNKNLNQLQRNIVWGQKGNFLDVPTDCPQRDERMGWTGDAQVFARTAAFNMDVAAFFTRWLADLAADQYDNGAIPWVIPDVLSSDESGAGSAGWADAGTIIPWTLYLAYGDTRILEVQYESMRAWVLYMKAQAGEDLVWSSGFHFGDWLAYSTTNPAYPGATTGTDVIATAFFAHSTGLLAKTARVLGRESDRLTYEALASDIRAAFQKEFVTATGRVAENTQTAYSLSLNFDLLAQTQRPEAARRLAADVRARENHLTTGFLGTPYLNDVLTRFGHLDVAYDLLLQESYPSWLYPVTQGATTIWERWDGQKPDGSFQSPTMNSFNHYAYGAVGDWMYRVVAGIDTSSAAPGYKHVIIHPRPGGGLTHAKASLETMYGTVVSSWKSDGNRFELTVSIPPNTDATVRLPDGRVDTIGSGTHHFEARQN